MQPGSIHARSTIERIAESQRRLHAYRQVAASARALIAAGTVGPLVLRAVKQALDLAPERDRVVWEKYHDALSHGRRIKTTTFPTIFILPPSDELVREVEAALAR